MPNPNFPPKEARVTVRIDSVDPLSFEFETNDLPKGPNKNELVFKNGKGHEGFHIYYTLDGADGYRFPPDLDDACFVAQGSRSECPSQASKWGQFQPLGIEDQGRTLKVWNKNDSVHDFAYTLRTSNGAGWLELDPGGINQNGQGNDP